MCQASRSVLDLTRKFKEEQSSRNTSVSVGSADHVHGNLLDAGVPRIQDVRQNISGIGLKAFVLHILPNDIGVRSHMVTPWMLLVQICLALCRVDDLRELVVFEPGHIDKRQHVTGARLRGRRCFCEQVDSCGC